MADFSSKTVFITGAASGIGRQIALDFARAGAVVKACDINPVASTALDAALKKHHPHSTCQLCDVTDEAAFCRLLDAVFSTTVDILVNNVGVGSSYSLEDMPTAEWDRVLHTNLRPIFLTARHLARAKTMGARIINIASTRFLMSEPNTEAYAASKGGVVSLTHALAATLAPYKITVNCISPGWVCAKDYGQLSVIDHAQHLSGRVGRPSDISAMCIYLASPENDFITGQNFIIDGGMTKKMIYME